jgi:C1A family cysteine protease
MPENQKRKCGYIPSPKDLRDYRISKGYKFCNLPSQFVVKHSNIKDQGYIGSCVAHSISEILEANDNTNYSTGWIYGYRPQGYYQGEGMITSQALKTVNKVGYVENKDFDINVEVPQAQILVNSQLEELKELASQKKVTSYARLTSNSEIKQALFSSGKPVLVAINIGTDGLILDKNFIAQIPESTEGGHQLVCFGWNELGFLIQNSWGTDWGASGTFILPYEYPIQEAWVINFEGEPIDSQIQVIKPNWFFWRNVIQKLIKLIKKIFKKEV